MVEWGPSSYRWLPTPSHGRWGTLHPGAFFVERRVEMEASPFEGMGKIECKKIDLKVLGIRFSEPKWTDIIYIYIYLDRFDIQTIYIYTYCVPTPGPFLSILSNCIQPFSLFFVPKIQGGMQCSFQCWAAPWSAIRRSHWRDMAIWKGGDGVGRLVAEL